MSTVEPLQPLFDFSSAPDPVSLYSGTAVLRQDKHSETGTGEVQLHFLPTPRIKIIGNFQRPSVALQSIAGAEKSSCFLLDGQEIEGWTIQRKLNFVAPGALEIHWSPRFEPLCMKDDVHAKAAVALVFHLFNFPDFRAGQHQSDAAPGCGLLMLESEDWRTSIQSLPDGNATHQAWERINQEGGCFLTHVAKLERKDGNPFSREDAREQHFLLSNFLSFVKAGRCWPVCEVGLDAAGARTWESFASPQAGNPPFSWFEKLQGHQAEKLFPLFAKRWQQSEAWRDGLKHAIYWYTQANTSGGHPGIDSAIILAQTALERLAHHYTVVDRKMISREGFKALKASDKLRMLFSSLDIPTEITETMADIQRVVGQCKWVDAPHAITDIRNSLVHPDAKRRVNDCFVDAWKLSLWYLELSILALCGYDDTYRNRLKPSYPGQVGHVPWRNAA